MWDGKPAEASEYATAMEAHLANGSIAAMFIDDGREVQVNDSVAPLVSADVWRAVKELCPNRLATGCRIEQLSIAGRHLLAAAVSIESKHGPAAVKRLKVVVAVDEEQEPMLVAQLRQWQFFGLHPANVAILPLQRYHGFAQNWQTERLQPTKASDRRLLGSGYALHLLSSPAEAYTLDADCSEPEVIRGSLLQWLEKHHVRHLLAGLFSDVERLRPDAMFDMTFLSGAQFSEERLGTNMAVEVITAPSETVMRAHDSVVLQRAGHVNRACDLRPSTLRTVNAHQLLAPLTSKGATIYVSTRRYLFTLPFLKAHAPNVSNFHADLRLQDFQAYASFDLSDVTTWDGAHCAAVSGSNLPGPLGKADTVYDKTWLSKAAAALEAQDAAPEFRKKAIAVLRAERAPTINPAGVSTASTSGMTTTASSAWGSRRTSIADSRRSTGAGAGANPFGAASAATLGAAGSALRTLQRSQGINVVLLLGPEHQAVAKMALKVAKRFLPNIVDKLHIVMVANYGESTLRIEQMLKELYDKELDFNEQIVRDTILRHEDTKTSDLLKAYCEDVGAAMVVVGSDTLTSTATATAGANVNSLAMLAARHVTNIPVLVVKSNASGTFVARTASDSAATDRCTAMVHLDAGNVAPVVSFVSSHLVSGQDRIILARPSAYERHGPMTMCTRRMFVQGRMAVKQGVEIVEQAFAGVASAELPAACAASSVDLLVVSVSGELPISKTIEELLKTVDSSVLIYRTPVEEGDMLSTIKI